MNRWLYVSLTLAALALGVSLYVYAYRDELLPDRVPTHSNIHGEPDKWTPRNEMLPQLVLLPIAMVLISVLPLVLPWLSPRRFGVEEFRETFNYLFALVVVLMAYLDVVILTGWTHPDLDVSRPLIAGIFLFFALMGNQLGKVRRNFWMGVRTPWTLASETVWTQTHRVAAWLFVAGGVLGFVAVLAEVPLILCFGVFMVAALVPVVYSLVLYKRLEREGKL
jgi:uncharacterized membrane protein